MSRIHVIGGTGYAGSNVVRQAQNAGHEVTVYATSVPTEPVPGVSYEQGNVLDDQFLKHAVADADVVVSALSPRGSLAGKTRGVLQKLARLADGAGVRLGVVGGAGSLRVSPHGPRLIDTDTFPDAAKPEASEMSTVLDDLKDSDPSLDWFYVSPAANFGAHAPGRATGRYRVGDDVLLVDVNGDSAISGPDLGQAVVDEIDHPAHHRARFTVAN